MLLISDLETQRLDLRYFCGCCVQVRAHILHHVFCFHWFVTNCYMWSVFINLHKPKVRHHGLKTSLEVKILTVVLNCVLSADIYQRYYISTSIYNIRDDGSNLILFFTCFFDLTLLGRTLPSMKTVTS